MTSSNYVYIVKYNFQSNREAQIEKQRVIDKNDL